MPIRLVLFDAGGTLTKVLPEREERLRRACHYFHLEPVPDERVARLGMQTIERFFIGTMQEGGLIDRETVREGVRLMLATMKVRGRLDDPALLWDFVETQYEVEVPMEGAIEVLEQLRADGYRLAIVSNASPLYERQLRSLGLAERVDALFLSDAVGYAKPDPRLFQFVLERMKAVPAETVHVGNSYWHDVIGARRADILPVYFDRRHILPDADCPRITDLRELPNLLRQLSDP